MRLALIFYVFGWYLDVSTFDVLCLQCLLCIFRLVLMNVLYLSAICGMLIELVLFLLTARPEVRRIFLNICRRKLIYALQKVLTSLRSFIVSGGIDSVEINVES